MTRCRLAPRQSWDGAVSAAPAAPRVPAAPELVPAAADLEPVGSPPARARQVRRPVGLLPQQGQEAGPVRVQAEEVPRPPERR